MLRDDKNPYVFMYNDVRCDLVLLEVKTWGLGSNGRLKNKSDHIKSREKCGFLASATSVRSSLMVCRPEASQKWGFWPGSATGRSVCYVKP